MQKFITNLWFQKDALQAAEYYTSVFENSRITKVVHYTKEGALVSGMKEGEVMSVDFELDDQQFLLINGGPAFKLSEAVSIAVNCKDQTELDRIWDALIEGGESSYCGWLTDKFGLSWQVIPEMLSAASPEEDSEAYERMLTELYKVQGKIDISKLEAAYKGA